MNSLVVPPDQLHFIRAVLPESVASFTIGLPPEELVMNGSEVSGATRSIAIDTIGVYIEQAPDPQRRLRLPPIAFGAERPLPGLSDLEVQPVCMEDYKLLRILAPSWPEIERLPIRLDGYRERTHPADTGRHGSRSIRPYKPPVAPEVILPLTFFN